MGRPAKSIEDHIKDGTYNVTRHRNRGVSFESLEQMSVPEELNKAAAEKWETIIPQLMEKGLITEVDFPELKDAFIHYGTAQDCLSYVNENFPNHAEYLASLNLCKGQCNLLNSYSSCMDYYNKIMHKFGATPMERMKIKVEPKKEDAGDDFIKALMKTGA